MILDQMLSNLPEYLKDGPKINEYFRILSVFLIEVQTILTQIEDAIDIDQATGILLDKLGENVNEDRLGDTDPNYRIRIRQKIVSGYSLGNIDTINTFASSVLGDLFLSIVEDANQTGGSPATLIVRHLPTTLNVPELIKPAVSGGVRIDDTARIFAKIAGVAVAGYDGLQQLAPLNLSQ